MPHSSFTTDHEKRFIAELGSIRPQHMQTLTKLQLLYRYKSSIAHRDEWGDIDKKAVLKYVTALIHSIDRRKGGARGEDS